MRNPGVDDYDYGYEAPEMLESGYHFHLVEKRDGVAVFVSENRRFFGENYLGQPPTFSPNQGMVSLERKF